MNISYNWLKTYIDCDRTADELSKILTSIGLEVGTVEKVQTIRGGLEGLVIGEVLTCSDHENSNHLHVTSVDIGGEENLQIVCGAPNVAAGQKVVVATIGTTLYSGDDSFAIKKSKIRGVESFGMLCGESEIGVGSDNSGIMVLSPDATIGTTAKEYFGVKDDYLIEVDITPNRADAISHYGVARDLAAYFNAHNIPHTLYAGNFNGEEKHFIEGKNIQNNPLGEEWNNAINNPLNIEIKVENYDLCPRYSGITICNIKVEESPKWLKDRLTTIGLKPINNIVDITNFVLHAFGQPLHAFDADKIDRNKVLVRTANEGEKFTTLDGVERTLNNNDLMICNAQKPMCIAGVFGGEESGVSNETKNIFIESAYFNPVSVRKTARRHGLNTDASFRYERGTDPNITIFALKYATKLITQIAGGEIASSINDIYPQKIEDFNVELSIKKTNSLIGKELTKAEIINILSGLEMKVTNESEDIISLQIPPYRTDVQRDVDVIEDILRIYGYNNIELSDNLRSNISYSSKIDNHKYTNLISEQLTAAGYNEILNNSLTRGEYYQDNNIWAFDNCVKLMNSLSVDLNVMRQTLLYGGLESITHNVNRQNANLKFYEFGNCYLMNNSYEGDDRTKAFKEHQHLSLWVTGNKSSLTWNEQVNKTSFYQLKAYTLNVLVRMGYEPRNLKIEEISNEIFSQALVLKQKSGTEIATIAILDTKFLKKMGISQEVFYADIAWDNALKNVSKRNIEFQEIPKYPEVRRDLALLVDKNIKFQEIERIAHDTEKKLLKNIVLFDVYEGKNLEAGKKSYAVNFTLQDNEKTLNDKQIDAIMQKLIKQLTDKLDAKLR